MTVLIELHRPFYTLREAAGLAGVQPLTLATRLDALFGSGKWGYKDRRRWVIPAGILRRYFDKGGYKCPECWRDMSTLKEIRLKELWRRWTLLKEKGKSSKRT